ncbi:MAG: hypothetical protein A2284_15145 [Deltaproteobacteria bacterium RIFOXYA12_FULL_61_11]|nr:MAG: hypothetical protein A2284_15145 [Deltaproteobacteria bacterium RIFOXYA12_FULL_61_11]
MFDTAIAAVIPVYNAGATLERCLSCLSSQVPAPHEIVLIDDASTDGGPAALSPLDGLRILRTDRRRGAAHARNLGLKATTAPLLLFLDADVYLQPGALAAMLEAISGHDLCHPQLRFEDGSPFSLNDRYPTIWKGAASNLPSCSACFLMRREAFARLDGPFDETFLIYYEDTEFFLRCHLAGLRSRPVPEALALHAAKPRHWTPQRFRLEVRHNLYVQLKHFPSSVQRSSCSVLGPAMPIWFCRWARSGAVQPRPSNVELARLLAEAFFWNLLRLPFTLRANLRYRSYCRHLASRASTRAGATAR